VQYRQSIMYPPDFNKDSEARRSDPTVFLSIDQWETKSSTKLSALISILKHILYSDESPIPKVSQHGKVDSALPSPIITTTPRDQVVLYVEFSGTHKTIQSVGSISWTVV